MKKGEKQVLAAYFSMEIAIDERLKNYAGGLGILAGDLLRSAADQEMNLVGISLLNRFGYFQQKIDLSGKQKYLPEKNDLRLLKKLKVKISVPIGKDQVVVGAWEYLVNGVSGGVVPVYLLDTDFPENKKIYRNLCDHLYGGNHLYRLRQEIILGRGGVKLLEALKIKPKKFHINEGHGAFALIELLLQNRNRADLRKVGVFTTHSPVKEDDDVFSVLEIKKNFADFPFQEQDLFSDDGLNMAQLAVRLCGFTNGVSKTHTALSRRMFANSQIKNITNGINLSFWTAAPLQGVFQKHFSNWQQDNRLFARRDLPLSEILTAHHEAKRDLFARILKLTGEFLDSEAFTMVVARRFTSYKRSTLILEDLPRLLKLQKKFGPLQIIYAGKAHPQDKLGQAMIKEIFQIKKKYGQRLKIVFLEDYGLDLAKLLVSGADLWINTPLPPNEASGTSGMKAAINGVPQLSTLDGWWREACREGKNGWAIQSRGNNRDNKAALDVLENKVLPLFFNHPEKWAKIMTKTIRLNAYQFSSERAIKEYKKMAYEK